MEWKWKFVHNRCFKVYKSKACVFHVHSQGEAEYACNLGNKLISTERKLALLKKVVTNEFKSKHKKPHDNDRRGKEMDVLH